MDPMFLLASMYAEGEARRRAPGRAPTRRLKARPIRGGITRLARVTRLARSAHRSGAVAPGHLRSPARGRAPARAHPAAGSG